MDLINCHCEKSMSHHRSRELSDGNLLEGKFDLFYGNFVSGWTFHLETELIVLILRWFYEWTHLWYSQYLKKFVFCQFWFSKPLQIKVDFKLEFTHHKRSNERTLNVITQYQDEQKYFNQPKSKTKSTFLNPPKYHLCKHQTTVLNANMNNIQMSKSDS